MTWTNYWLLIMWHTIKWTLVLPCHMSAIAPLETSMAGQVSVVSLYIQCPLYSCHQELIPISLYKHVNLVVFILC